MRPSLMPISARVSVVTLVMGLSSCGSDNKASSGSVTSVDHTKTLNSLSTSDIQTLCQDASSYLVTQVASDYAQRNCIQSAITATSLGTPSNPTQACRDSFAACMNLASKSSAGISIAGLCPSNGSPGSTTCSLTVGDYVRCLDEITAAARAAWSLKSGLCDAPTSCSGLCLSPLSLPSSCVTIRDTCAALLPSVDYTQITQ